MKTITTHRGRSAMVVYETIEEVMSLSLDECISWLQSNDRNGCYSREDQIAEFGEVFSIVQAWITVAMQSMELDHEDAEREIDHLLNVHDEYLTVQSGDGDPLVCRYEDGQWRLRGFWIPELGSFRIHGEENPRVVSIRNKKEVLCYFLYMIAKGKANNCHPSIAE